MKPKILVVDDERQVARICAHFLNNDGWAVDCAYDADEAIGKLRSQPPGMPGGYGIVFLDIKMPKKDGLEALSEIKRFVPGVEVIMITAHGTMEVAVECMKRGACDFVAKPFKKERVLAAAHHADRIRALSHEVHRLQSEVQTHYRFDNLIGGGHRMQEVYEWIARSAESDSAVLILGESGTGKDLVARTIHFNSARREAPFIAVNCAALPKELIESELFGHKKGAFTGAVSDNAGIFRAADGGTVFLDEIVEMPAGAQAKLLRAIQERRVRPVGASEEVAVDVRIIAATNRDIDRSVEEEGFREDLYYRISVISFRMPPLRDRAEDIPALVKHFVERINSRGRRKIEEVEPAAMEALVGYRWGGNVRELENVIERCTVMGKGNRIRLKDLPPGLVKPAPDADAASARVRTLSDAEREAVVEALSAAKGNISQAARLLGITRKRLYRIGRDHELKL